MIKSLLLSLVFAGVADSLMASYRGLAVLAHLDPGQSALVSQNIKTTVATKVLRDAQTAAKAPVIYFAHREDDSQYHITLDVYSPHPGMSFSGAEVTMIKDFLDGMQRHGHIEFPYKLSVYELRLFVHFETADAAGSNRGQYAIKAKTAGGVRSIDELSAETRDVTYAHLVAKVGSPDGRLRDSWGVVRSDFSKSGLDATFKVGAIALQPLETHISIAQLCKYDGNKYKFDPTAVGRTRELIVSKKQGHPKVYNMPFLASRNETTILVDYFKAAAQSFTDAMRSGFFPSKSIPVTVSELLITSKKPDGTIEVLGHVADVHPAKKRRK